MYKFINFFSCLIFSFNSHKPLNINHFKEIRYISSEIIYPNEFFVNNKKDAILLEFYNKNEKIGHIRYYTNTGQIGSFYINYQYQNRGLGKQILSKVITELKLNNCKEAWAVTTQNHSFWTNVYNKSFIYRDPAHPSVYGNGYFIKL